jgi:hypothetical protein
LICEGGYPKYNCFICPLSTRVDRQSVIFSEYLESSRKDVECTFGQLKNRFRIFRRPLEMSSEYEMELLFNSCCILHNMIIAILSSGKQLLIGNYLLIQMKKRNIMLKKWMKTISMIM